MERDVIDLLRNHIAEYINFQLKFNRSKIFNYKRVEATLDDLRVLGLVSDEIEKSGFDRFIVELSRDIIFFVIEIIYPISGISCLYEDVLISLLFEGRIEDFNQSIRRFIEMWERKPVNLPRSGVDKRLAQLIQSDSEYINALNVVMKRFRRYKKVVSRPPKS
mgnify:CR=1 FL=1